MGAICLVSAQGHVQVMDAFTEYRRIKHEKHRFERIVQELKKDDIDYSASLYSLMICFNCVDCMYGVHQCDSINARGPRNPNAYSNGIFGARHPKLYSS
jgi:hypothetical protein